MAGTLNWAMAGHSAEKLAAVRDEIGASAETPLVVADASDPQSVRDMVARGKVIARRWAPISFMAAILWRRVPNWAQIMSICPANRLDARDDWGA